MDIELSEAYQPLFELLHCWDIVNDPDFTKNYTEKEQEYWLSLKGVDTVIMKGGRDCFMPNQEITTKNGPKRIKDIKKGELVLTFNEKKGKKEFNKVLNTRKVKKKKTVKIKLKNGDVIECTPDHKFYYNGGWVMIKDLLSLWYGDMGENTTI